MFLDNTASNAIHLSVTYRHYFSVPKYYSTAIAVNKLQVEPKKISVQDEISTQVEFQLVYM